MKLVLDTSVWIEHLRHDTLEPLMPALRRHQLWMHALVAGELLAGCRSRAERGYVDTLIAPFVRANRLPAPHAMEIADAGRALSLLRAQGVSLSHAALIDATIAVGATRLGALLVTENARDFEKLSKLLPLQWERLSGLPERLARTSA